MDSCLSADYIISKLNLRGKFSVQGVCRQWKNIALQCLRHHEYLVISKNAPDYFWYYGNCDEPPSLITGDNNNLIWGKQTDLKLWQSTLSLLQGVKYTLSFYFLPSSLKPTMFHKNIKYIRCHGSCHKSDCESLLSDGLH